MENEFVYRESLAYSVEFEKSKRISNFFTKIINKIKNNYAH